ncbi:MAG: MFS transporter, partial [Pseudomonadales bacterium]
MSPVVTRLQLLQYSVLALPLAFAGLPIYLLAPDFYATSYQVSLTSIGIGLLILRLLDAAIDPLLGYLIDCRAQQFKLLIRLGVACMAAGVLMLFWVPD